MANAINKSILYTIENNKNALSPSIDTLSLMMFRFDTVISLNLRIHSVCRSVGMQHIKFQKIPSAPFSAPESNAQECDNRKTEPK